MMRRQNNLRKKGLSNKKRVLPLRVFFNASVILAGFYSPTGGSAKLLKWQKQKIITGVISEIVLDEVVRRSVKIGLTPERAKQLTVSHFPKIAQAPLAKLVAKQKQIIVDHGDAHLLASSIQIKADYLVSLDKKHILSLKGKVKKFKIVSPKELIELLSLVKE